jgi:replicative DNA helicase
MPWDADAEKGVLSCFLHDPVNLLPRAAVELGDGGTAFYHPANQLLYQVMQEFSRTTDKPVEYIALTNYLRDSGQLDKVGGAGMLSELLNFVPTPTHYGYYVGILKGKQLLRRIINESVESVNKAYECHDVTKAAEVVSEAEARVFQVLSEAQASGEGSRTAVPAKQVGMDWMEHLQRIIDNRGKVLGLTTGLHDVDRTMHGIDDEEGEIFTIAARPGMGKTALGVTLAHHLATVATWEDAEGKVHTGIPGVIFSVEMSKNQLLNRMILGMAGIDTSKAHTGHFSRDDFKQMHAGLKKFRNAPLWICDASSFTTSDLRSQLQVLKRKHGIRWAMVDHLHLVKPVSEKAQKDERLGLVEVMETLQFCKKEFHLGIFLMVQMSRESDRNAGKEPVLADLQGSAAIEQFSDHVGFIHRPSVYKPWHKLSEEEQGVWQNGHDEQRRRNPDCWSDGSKYPNQGVNGTNDWARQDYEEHAVLVLRKNRRGPTPPLPVRFEPEYTRFSSRTPTLYSNHEADRQVDAGTGMDFSKLKPKQRKEKEPLQPGEFMQAPPED